MACINCIVVRFFKMKVLERTLVFLLIRYRLTVISGAILSVTKPGLKQYQMWMNNCFTGVIKRIWPVLKWYRMR